MQKEHFSLSKTNKLSKIINKYAVKVNYSCIPHFKQAILNHNKSLLQDQTYDQYTSEKTAKLQKQRRMPPSGKMPHTMHHL